MEFKRIMLDYNAFNVRHFGPEVRLYQEDDGSCEPAAGITDTHWHAFFMTLGTQRLLTQEVAQYFTQVALQVDVKSSQAAWTEVVGR